MFTEHTNEDGVPGDIQHALNFYDESDALGKMVILALIHWLIHWSDTWF